MMIGTIVNSGYKKNNDQNNNEELHINVKL